MSDRIEDGGPAFPHHDAGDTGTRPGISMRDWFAGQALAGIISNPHNRREVTLMEMAGDCYRFADAMLEARK